jgi:glycosyltransferase involved in cell wall biosynthesis
MSMRIAHLTSVHPRDDVRIFLKECQSLVRLGYDVHLVVADGLGDSVQSAVHVHDVGKPRGRLSRVFQVTSRVLRQALALDADVYHLHDPELLLICRALKRRGKKVIFDAHEDVPKQILGKHYLPVPVRAAIAWSFARFENYVCRRLDGVIAATPTIREKFKAIQAHVVDVNNYPILGELDPPAEAGPRGKVVCYVGNIAAIRGIQEMVQAMALTRSGARLDLVGEFSELTTLQEVRRHEGWHRVRQCGVLDRSGVRDVLAHARAGLVTLHPAPNYVEALPIKMFEYMAAGVPVVASNFPLWMDIVEGAKCGVCVDPLDPAKIAEAIDQFVTQPEMGQEMGRNGRLAVLSRYNWAQEEQKLDQFYRRLCA